MSEHIESTAPESDAQQDGFAKEPSDYRGFIIWETIITAIIVALIISFVFSITWLRIVCLSTISVLILIIAVLFVYARYRMTINVDVQIEKEEGEKE